MQEDNLDFKWQVLSKLDLLNIESFEKYMQNYGAEKYEESEDQFINLFPLDMENLIYVEHLLMNKDDSMKLRKHLSRVGGSCLSDIVKRLMYKLFTNEVGSSFSWDGAKGKKKFKNLRISDVILNTVQANNNTANATDADVIIHIKKWLVKSKERMKTEIRKSSVGRPNSDQLDYTEI